MTLEKYLNPDFFILSLLSEEKENIIRELLLPLSTAGVLRDEKKAFEDILEREKLCSTGLEGGIAVPHAKTDQVDSVYLVIGIHREGVDFDSLDGNPSQLFFLIVSSVQHSEEHLNLLSQIGKIALNSDICKTLLQAETNDDVLKALQEASQNV